jgi:hypothetical protein
MPRYSRRYESDFYDNSDNRTNNFGKRNAVTVGNTTPINFQVAKCWKEGDEWWFEGVDYAPVPTKVWGAAVLELNQGKEFIHFSGWSQSENRTYKVQYVNPEDNA